MEVLIQPRVRSGVVTWIADRHDMLVQCVAMGAVGWDLKALVQHIELAGGICGVMWCKAMQMEDGICGELHRYMKYGRVWHMC